MKKTELKALIREAVEEVMAEFAPLGVAEEKLNEKTPPNFPRALEKKLLAQYKDTPQKAYATMWTIHNAKNEGNERVCEMWTAWENKSVNEAEEANADQNAEHDETDLSNPEEKQEVELAKQIKTLADQLLSMHGVEAEESKENEQGNEASEEQPETEPLNEKWGVEDAVHPSKKGMFKGKTKADLEKQLNNLKAKGPHKKGSKEYTKMKELQFAIRAKSGWGKVKK